MKYMLIALNIFLVAAVAHLAWTYSSEPLEFASTSKKFSPAKLERKRAAATVKRVKKDPLDSPEVTEQKITALLDHNIFKTERVPEAPANKNAQRNNQQIRADMSLVGTYVIGDSLGAIILQRLQGNSQQQLKALQQKEYEQYALSSNRVTDPKKKAATAAEADEDASLEDDIPLDEDSASLLEDDCSAVLLDSTLEQETGSAEELLTFCDEELVAALELELASSDEQDTGEKLEELFSLEEDASNEELDSGLRESPSTTLIT